MMSIIKKEFLAKRTSLLVYCLVVFGLLWMYIGIYPSIQAQSAALSKVLEGLGPAVRAFGVSQISFDTLEKYLSLELFGITWPILMITFVAARAGQSIAGETEKGTLGTVLSLPISRYNIFLSKYLAGLTALIIFVAVTVFSGIPIAQAFHIAHNSANFASLSVLCLLFSWSLYSLGMLFSTVFNEKGHVYLALGGILMVMYVANIIAGISSKFSWLRLISLFHFFNAAEVLINNQTNSASYIVFNAVIVFATLAGLFWFAHKDVIV
ncbi:MAG TPA: ABC transporter permease subunit [Candidatus Nanoarchaeia archaeon]|nr:ABC transporter permease subunit [Candidatus Nanoarchaeia archaeon]